MQKTVDPQRIYLGDFESIVSQRLQRMDEGRFVARFWQKDATLWGGDSERQKDVAAFLGWIDAIEKVEEKFDEIDAFVADIRSAGFERAILAGMGGSSLAPLVFSTVIGKKEGGIPLHVLDSTNPATVLEIERLGDLAKTLVIVASKSGTTAEPTAFDNYLFDKVGKPENFVAITDPGSPFQHHAQNRRFRKVFLNYSDVGGRFSALTLFGLVPAALLGLDFRALVAGAREIAEESGPSKSAAQAPAMALGAALGELALAGKDKLTFLTPPHLHSMGLWMEQLVAESTGKLGRGILPIAGESFDTGAVYGNDRVFVMFNEPGSAEEAEMSAALSRLLTSGHPVVSIDLNDPYSVAQEFFRFEIATAVAGSVLDINPFDQPNVQESKDVTRRLLAQVENDGTLPEPPVSLVDHGIKLFGDSCAETLPESIRIFLHGRQPGDYVAIMAYLPESETLNQELSALQRAVRDLSGLATTVGYGPRFLHSTGQFHKGGPNTGYFLQLTADHAEDAPIPGQRATWAQMVDAQAMGDLEALRAKDRRTLRFHLPADVAEAVRALHAAFNSALTHD